MQFLLFFHIAADDTDEIKVKVDFIGTCDFVEVWGLGVAIVKDVPDNCFDEIVKDEEMAGTLKTDETEFTVVWDFGTVAIALELIRVAEVEDVEIILEPVIEGYVLYVVVWDFGIKNRNNEGYWDLIRDCHDRWYVVWSSLGLWRWWNRTWINRSNWSCGCGDLIRACNRRSSNLILDRYIRTSSCNFSWWLGGGLRNCCNLY